MLDKLKDVEFCASEEDLILKETSNRLDVNLYVLCNTDANFPDPKSVNGKTETPFKNVGFHSFNTEKVNAYLFKIKKESDPTGMFFVVENFPRLELDPGNKLAVTWPGKAVINVSEPPPNYSSVFFDR